MKRHFVRAGAHGKWDGPAAPLLPAARTRPGGVRALALRSVSGAMPLLIFRDPGRTPAMRVVDARDLMEWLGSLHAGSEPRGAS